MLSFSIIIYDCVDRFNRGSIRNYLGLSGLSPHHLNGSKILPDCGLPAVPRLARRGHHASSEVGAGTELHDAHEKYTRLT